MVKKILLIILTFFIVPLFSFAEVVIPKGTLVKVYAKAPVTTQNLEEGSVLYFHAAADVWVLENKVVAKGDIFVGHVSMLKMPILGVNAALSIDIDAIVKQNGEKHTILGKIIFSNTDVLGGNLTNPLSYNKSFYPRKVYGNIWGGTYMYVPSGEYEFGQHVRVDSRDLIFVEFSEDHYFWFVKYLYNFSCLW